MNKLLMALSYLGLLLVIVPALMYLSGSIEKSSMMTTMLVGTVLWFVTVPFWMGKKSST